MAESTCNAPHSSHSQAPWGPCLSPSASPARGASHPPSSPALTGGWGPWQPPGPRPPEGSWRRAPGENTSRSAPGGQLCPQSPTRGAQQQQQHFPIRTMRALGTHKRGSGQDRRPQYSATLLVSWDPPSPVLLSDLHSYTRCGRPHFAARGSLPGTGPRAPSPHAGERTTLAPPRSPAPPPLQSSRSRATRTRTRKHLHGSPLVL